MLLLSKSLAGLLLISRYYVYYVYTSQNSWAVFLSYSRVPASVRHYEMLKLRNKSVMNFQIPAPKCRLIVGTSARACVCTIFWPQVLCVDVLH